MVTIRSQIQKSSLDMGLTARECMSMGALFSGYRRSGRAHHPSSTVTSYCEDRDTLSKIKIVHLVSKGFNNWGLSDSSQLM